MLVEATQALPMVISGCGPGGSGGSGSRRFSKQQKRAPVLRERRRSCQGSNRLLCDSRPNALEEL